MDQCVRNYRRFTGCSAAAAITAASSRPARLLLGAGLPLPGSLSPGAPADLVLLHADSLAVLRVFCDGRPAWP
jgi:N-acetylglucosamine-6-phosphate deacetylase